MVVDPVQTKHGPAPDLPDGYTGGWRRLRDGRYELTDWDDRDVRIDVLERAVDTLILDALEATDG